MLRSRLTPRSAVNALKRRVLSTDDSSKKSGEEETNIFTLIPTKYWVVIAPTIVVGSVVGSIVNVEPIRDAAEDCFPSLVNLVRKYVGIDDKELRVRKAWLRSVTAEQARVVDAKISFEDGRQLLVEDVSGTLRHSDFITSLLATISSTGAGSAEGSCIVNIEFVGKSENRGSVEGGVYDGSEGGSSGNAVNNADEVEVELHPEHPDRERNYNPKVGTPGILLGGGDSEGSAILAAETPLLRSLWDVDFTSDLGTSKFTSPALGVVLATACNGHAVRGNDRGGSSGGDGAPSLTLRRALKYNNLLGYLCGGLRLYDSRGGHLSTRTLRYKKPLVVTERAQNRQIFGAKRSASKSSGPTADALLKYDVQKMIAGIDHDIELLRREQRGGGGGPSVTGRHREIDEIESDIAKLKAKKTELQRKYLNWFYYF